MLRVLIIGHVWPEPRSSAAGSRMLELIDIFRGQEWEVIFATPALAGGHQAGLLDRGVECQSITLNSDTFNAFVAARQPDIVLFDRFMTEEQFGWRVAEACPSALRVLDTEDLHSLRQVRQRELKGILRRELGEEEQDSATAEHMLMEPAELFKRMASEDLAFREIAAIHRCDLTLIISEFEYALLARQFGIAEASLHYCPFMLESESRPGPAFGDRAHFISIGNFRHAPNWDAVLWLKQRLWPAIRARLQDAQVHLYGAYPPPKATALSAPRDGFLVKGWAADAQEVLGRARVCLAPLRFGAGLKGKLVDAMAAGTPTVTTPLGAEGMAGSAPWPGIVATDPQALVHGAVDLYSNRSRWLQAQQGGRALLAARFARSRHGPALISKLQHCRENLGARRQSNFTGAMLRHHFHQSTYYMSRWIEAKNRLKQEVGNDG